MKFSVKQNYASRSPSEVAEAFRNASLYKTLSGLPFVGSPELIGVSSDDGRFEAKIRYVAHIDLPAVALSFIDPSRLSFVEASSVDESGIGTFQIKPDHYDKMLKCGGKISVSPSGNGCSREMSGELSVDLGWKGKLLEGQVEKIIVNGLRDYLHAEVAQVEAFIASEEGSKRS